MTSIVLQYRPYNIFPLRKIEKNMPSCWDELSPRQLQAIPLFRRGLLSETRMLQIFLGVKRTIARRIGAFQALLITNELSFLNKPSAVSYFAVGKISGFRAPADKLKNVNFGQFIFADTYFQSYLEGNTDDLNRFIACFYTDRVGFNENSIENKAKIIRAASIFRREAIAVNYALVREWLSNCYPFVFEHPYEGQKKQKSAGWVAIFDQIVGDDIVNSDSYAAKPVNEMLRFMNKQRKEYLYNGRNLR